MKKLTILDGNSLLFRAYYASAYPGATIMRTKGGVPTNAIYIFANMIVRVLEDLAPGDGLLVAFDTGKKTFRHEQLESYKAQRKKAPDELIAQMPIARELLEKLGIFSFEMDGFEGDDVAGSAAMTAHKEGYNVSIFTSDGDFLQLVNGAVRIHLIKKGMSDIRLMSRDKVIEDWGIAPEQIPDYKGLCGDASDNLPGIPGIGDKTAVKLLNEYQTLENIVANADTIGGKIGQNLKDHQAMGFLCKKLAIIDTDMELPFAIADTAYQGYDHEEALAFGTRYELRTFLGKLPLNWKRQTSNGAIKVRQVARIGSFPKRPAIGLYLDASETNYHKAALLGVAVSDGTEALYLKLEDARKDDALTSLLKEGTVLKRVYDLKATYVLLKRHGIDLDGPYFDAMLASYTLDTSFNPTPEALLGLYGAQFPAPETTLIDNDTSLKTGQIAGYLCRLAPKMDLDLKQKQATSILYDLEQPLALVLAKMEMEGVPLNGRQLEELGATFKTKMNQAADAVYGIVGHEFNLNSPKQVAAVLFDELGLKNPRKGSTGADVLKYLADAHPVVVQLLEYRKYAKLFSTYIDTLCQHIHPDGKIHAIFNQALTSTGRLSSVAPNLQNIAVRDEEGRLVRQAFAAEAGHVFVSFDYSQIELRILAHLSACPPLIKAFNEGADIHAETAKALFAHEGTVTPLMRRKAKAVNFGIIYGISDWGLSEQLDIPPADAKTIIKAFYAAYPEVQAYMKDLIDQVQNNGYVTTLLGRRRYLREIHDTNYQTREFAKRAAMNAPIQGTAADLIKLAMVAIDQALETHKLDSRLILQIHDELIFKAPKHEADRLIVLVTPLMENAFPLNVRLKVAASVGRTWYDLKE